MTDLQQEVMIKVDQLGSYGRAVKEDYKQTCRERGIPDFCFISEYTEAHLEVCNEVWERWHKTEKFKVGDKVYVVPTTFTSMKNCIRATITEVGTDEWGYRLRAFERDLPGIYMFNIWDKDLQPRVDKSNMPVPAELLLKRRSNTTGP